jgi:hypothetical protein
MYITPNPASSFHKYNTHMYSTYLYLHPVQMCEYFYVCWRVLI